MMKWNYGKFTPVKNNIKMDKDNTVKIYTDGSCLGNPGTGGWAAIINEGGNEKEIFGGEKETTNNRMEMMAVIKSLEYLHEKYGRENLQSKQISFFIDSNLVVQTLNSGWKKKKNQDLWAKIESLSAWLNIKWEWVKAHHEDEVNIRVDKLANDEAKRKAKER